MGRPESRSIRPSFCSIRPLFIWPKQKRKLLFPFAQIKTKSSTLSAMKGKWRSGTWYHIGKCWLHCCEKYLQVWLSLALQQNEVVHSYVGVGIEKLLDGIKYPWWILYTMNAPCEM